MHLVKFLSACCLALASTAPFAPSWAAGAAHAPAVSVIDSSTNPNWANLTPQQQAVLRPLAGQWSSLEPSSKDKWINVASRYPQLTPQEQARVQDRMTQWAKLPPKARGEARLRFQQKSAKKSGKPIKPCLQMIARLWLKKHAASKNPFSWPMTSQAPVNKGKFSAAERLSPKFRKRKPMWSPAH